MNPYKKYILITSAYFLLAAIGVIAAILFLGQKEYFLVFISVLFALVAFDNTFCSAHARACGIRAKGHYTFPVFIKQLFRK